MTPEAAPTPTKQASTEPPVSQQEATLRRLARGSEQPVIVRETTVPSGLSPEAEEQLRR